jgi:hypothetical protein
MDLNKEIDKCSRLQSWGSLRDDLLSSIFLLYDPQVADLWPSSVKA